MDPALTSQGAEERRNSPNGTFRYCEVGDDGLPTGKSIEFSCANIQPLGFKSLNETKLHMCVSLPMTWEDASVLASNIEAVSGAEIGNFNAPVLNTPYTAQAIGLIKGGWLPSALAAINENCLILADRNIISQIIARFKNGKPINPKEDFLDWFAGRSLAINPVLFAIEGNSREVPTPEVVQAQFNEAVSKLRSALPSAKLADTVNSLKGAIGLIEDTRLGIGRKQTFLTQLAPALSAPISKRNTSKRWDEALAVADGLGVPRHSLVVLAVLSAIMIANGQSPARRLLKFKPKYSKKDAYNPICDLRALEILVGALCYFPERQTQLCTADRNLALFWTGIRASNFRIEADKPNCTLSPVEEILPLSALEQWRDCL